MGSPSPRDRRSRQQSPLALAALVLVLCALVAATFDGPRWSGLRGDAERTSLTEADGAEERPEATAAEESEPPQDDEPWLPWVPPLDLLLLVPAALVFGVALMVVARLRLVRRRRHVSRRAGPRASAGTGDELPIDEEPPLPDALDEGARSIGEGSPRNAIVATWVRLEQAVEGERFPHRPEETPSELVERALASYHLDGEAIRRLAALYREARFSTHPVTEEHRREAAECLQRLLATIRPGAAR